LFEVGQILGARGNVGSKISQMGGTICVNIEPSILKGDSGKILLQLRGIRLKNCQYLGRVSSLYYELYRKIDRPTGASWISVYRSNVIRKDLNPMWNGTTLDIGETCNSDFNRSMKVIVWDHCRSGKHKMMGEFETTMKGFIKQMMENQGEGFTLIPVDKRVMTVGQIEVLEALISGPI
jgi:C2 domain